MNRRIIIAGGGGHARVLLDILKEDRGLEIAGYVDPARHADMPIPYLGADDEVRSFSPHDVSLVNGIGSISFPHMRRRVYEHFHALGYRFMKVLHANCLISKGAILGPGVQVMAGATIITGAVIGENAIINTSAIVDHDCEIGPHTHVSPGTTLAGGVKIGKACHIGAGATLIQGVFIGDRSIIGAGSVVLCDIPEGSKAYGVPAKIVDQPPPQPG